MAIEQCKHEDSEITECGTLWCNDCRRELRLSDGAVIYDERSDDAIPA